MAELVSFLKDELPRPSFFKFFSAFSGQQTSRFALIVAIVRIPNDVIFKRSVNVQNQLSKHILKFFYVGVLSHKRKTAFSHEQPALLALLPE